MRRGGTGAGQLLRLLGLCCTLALAVAGEISEAQDAPRNPLRSNILTIDPDILYQDSAYGQSIANALDAELQALAAENRRIEDALRAEELALTEARATMEPDAFLVLAQEYDEKVQRTRREQDAKESGLLEARDAQVQVFLNDIRPILARMMVEAGATVIVDRRSVFVSFNAIDITSDAIARIDAALSPAGPEPEPDPDPTTDDTDNPPTDP